MSDSLKDFINRHKDEFDAEQPSPRVRQVLEGKIEALAVKQEKKQRRPWVAYVAVAASVVIAFTLCVPNLPETKTAHIQPPAEQAIVPRIIEVEQYYTLQVNKKMEALLPYETSQPEVKAETDQALHFLDSTYQQLKRQLKTEGNHDKTVHAMIKNLQVRIDILNSQLNKLTEIKRIQKQQEHEKISL